MVAPSVTNLHTHGRGAKATRVAKNRTVGRGEYDGACRFLSIGHQRHRGGKMGRRHTHVEIRGGGEEEKRGEREEMEVVVGGEIR